MQASSVSTGAALLCPNSARTRQTLQSSAFHGVSFKPIIRSFTLSTGTRGSLTVEAAAKKAVAVLKGDSNVEGVVTLTQDEGGPYLLLNLDPICL